MSLPGPWRPRCRQCQAVLAYPAPANQLCVQCYAGTRPARPGPRRPEPVEERDDARGNRAGR
jgi:hypothetical protein